MRWGGCIHGVGNEKYSEAKTGANQMSFPVKIMALLLVA